MKAPALHLPDVAPAERLPPLEFARLFRRLFGYTAPYRVKRNWLIVQVLLRSALLPLGTWAAGAIIGGPVSRGDMAGIAWSVTGFLALVFVTNFLFHYRSRLALELGEAVVHDLRGDMFRRLQAMTMSFYHEWKPGRIISRMTSDVDAVRLGIQDTVFIGTVQVGQMLIVAGLMLYYDGVLFLVVLSIAPIVWWLNHIFTRKVGDAQRRAQTSYSRVTATMVESVEGIRVTQGFVREEVNAGFFRALVKDHSRYSLDAARATAIFLPLLELNSQLFVAILLVLGGWRVMNPHVHAPIGDVVQFFLLANFFFDPIRTLGVQYSNALAATVSAERIFRLLDARPDWEDPPEAAPLPQIEGRVEFHGVGFAYKPGQPVLRGVSFVAEPGQTVALVGHTGSGKTSIINLIAKMYLVGEGELLVDGRDLRVVQSESLHRQMGMVHQHSFLFGGTVLDNIRFARPEASAKEVIEAASRLDYLDLIEALPDGFYTEVGEAGGNLSAGQRQLISFTRALLSDPRILILDEATSAVDTLTEARIQRSIAALLRNRTSFVVAHRLSTIREADLILVLDHGEIIERGTHEALLAHGGIYGTLHEQFVRASTVR